MTTVSENDLLSNLLRCSGEGVIQCDNNFVIRYWSSSMNYMVPMEGGDPTSQNLEVIFPDLLTQNPKEQLKRLLSGEIKNLSLLQPVSKGHLCFNIHPFISESAEITGILLVVTTKHEAITKQISQIEDHASDNIKIQEILSLTEIQELQDAFCNATGVASIITDSNGNPVTRPSNFCGLCQNVIRNTPKGLENCIHSDASLGRVNLNGPIIQNCLSGGLWDGGTSIFVQGKHVANWLIGQVLVGDETEEKLLSYGREIGADEIEFKKELKKVNRMPLERFKSICNLLFLMARHLSNLATRNIEQGKEIRYRMKLEEALIESTEYHSITLDSIGDGVIVTDKDGIIKKMNPVAENLTGYSQDEAYGTPLQDIFLITNTFTGKPIENLVLKVQKSLQISELTNHTELTSKDDKKHQISQSAAPILKPDGSLMGVVVVFKNVTERYEKAKALRKNQERLKRAQEVASIGDWEFNPIAKELTGSDEAFKIIGLNVESAIPFTEVLKVIHPADTPKLKIGWKKILSGGTFKADLKIIRANDGQTRVVNVIAKLVLDDGQPCSKAIGTIQDITEFNKTELELKTRNNELNHFVYKVSHDLRAPLCSIFGLLDLYKLEEAESRREELVKLIEGRSKKMDLFIRDILSHSKNLNTDVKVEKINFQEIIDDCFKELSFLPNASKVDRVISIKGDDFYSDTMRIREIFRNLISNSITYYNPDQPYSYFQIDVTIRNYLAFIKFKDNGVGIESKVLPHIFEMFYRGNERSDGSGIGLYILQQAVLKLNGEVRVDSKPGIGCKFAITLPNLNKN